MKKNENKIPKQIFYVWGANERKNTAVNLCLFSWQQQLPDYQIIEINENSTEFFDFQKELKTNKWFNTVYNKHMYAYVADYIRIKVLYEHGGIYLDTDVSVLKSFDEYLNNPAFVGIQNDSKTSVDNLEPAILGAQKGNFLLKEILNFYNQKVWELPIYSMPQIFDHYITKLYGKITYPPKNEQNIIELENITLYPAKYFIPINYGNVHVQQHLDVIKYIEPETTTIHWYNASWLKPEIKFFLENKHKYSLKELEQKIKTKYTKITIQKTIPFSKNLNSNIIELVLHNLTIYLRKIALLQKIYFS